MTACGLALVPRALLLDFGGVVFETAKHADGRDRMAAHLVGVLARAGHQVDLAFARSSLDSALTALKHWKHASSRRLAPREMDHREIVRDFLAADYPMAARELLVAEASELLDTMSTMLSAHTIRPGIRQLLAEADRLGVPVGIVSNAHSGRSHRRLMAEHGIDRMVDVQVYSDEVGVRKPHPRMITLATDALGVEPEECWYVGDTRDRDVMAGRRAGVGAVVLTRTQHTDDPPFTVTGEPDAVFDTPVGLVEALLRATSAEDRRPVGPVAQQATRRPVLFIDHGGVISVAHKDPAPLHAFAEDLAALLSDADEKVSGEDALDLVAAGRRHYVRFKAEQLAAGANGDGVREVTPRQFWGEMVGAGLGRRRRTLLEVEADDLMWRYAQAKSIRRLRPGVTQLLTRARELGLTVVVVSNTMSGRVVREECRKHGLGDLIGAFVCSDEVGLRKPDGRIVEVAARLADADLDRSWFFGDKPQTDAAAAMAAGVARRVLTRGGSTPDDLLAEARATGLATDLVDDAHGLLALLDPPHSLGDTATHPSVTQKARR